MLATGNWSKPFQDYLGDSKYHVFAAYNKQNATEVRLFLERLREAGFLVYDPALERKPGEFS